MSKEMERLKDDINIKETTIQSIESEFKQSTEVNVGKETNLYCIISQQSREIKHLQTELKTRSINHTIVQTELRHALKELKQSKCELEYKREKAFTTQKQMNKMFQENKHLKIEISKNAREIQERHDSSKIAETLKNDTDGKMISIVDEANRQIVYLQEQLKQSCGVMASLSEDCTKLRYSFQQKPIQISELKHGAERNAKTFHERETEMTTTNHSFQRQFEDAGNEFETSKQEIALEENQSNVEMTRLRSEIKDDEASKSKNHLDDLQKTSNQEENELGNNNISLEQQLNIAKTELRQKEADLHCRNRQKEDEVRELKKQLSEILKTASQKENESKQNIHSIEQQLKYTEANMRQQQWYISQEKKLMGTKDKGMVKMTEEIKSLKLQVKQKESTLQKCIEQYNDAVKLKQETESKLNEVIHNHKTEIQHLQEDIERKDNEIARIEQINLRYEKVQSTLNESQEKEFTFRETIKELRKTNQENENRICELKRKLVKTSEESHKMEIELKETKHLLNGKIKSIETEKNQYRQDILNTKQLSKAAQIMKDTRINDLTNKLKTKEEDLQKGKENLSGIIDSQKEQIQHLEREVQKRERKMESVQIEKNNKLQEMDKNMVELENQMKNMLSKLRDTEAELDETKSRLSRVRANNLSDNNPNITDLSDRNRPTKIAEKCAELYDNEWTDAFDVLEKLFRTEEAAIEANLLILQNAMHFCKTMAQRQIEFIEREMYFADEKEKIAVSSDIQKLIKDRRKATATAVVGNLKKIYVAQLKQSKDKIMRAALDVEPYTSECIEICWFMLIQDPPVVFAPLPIKGSNFDTNFYKPYTKSGTHVDFAVWPALLLHERGPILAKGVAQGHGNK